MRCGATIRALGIRGQPWVCCTLDVSHMQYMVPKTLKLTDRIADVRMPGWCESLDESPHYDATRNYYWHGPQVDRDEWPRGRFTKAGSAPTKKGKKLCDKCGKRIGTVDTARACLCAEIGANKSQAIMFAEEREKSLRTSEREEWFAEVDEFFDDLERRWQEVIAEMDEPYYGSF